MHSNPRKPRRAAARTYRDLIAWQVSMDLVVEAYRIAHRLPSIERYGLTSQLRRSAVSLPTNIAEGFGRGTRGELSRFLFIAEGSLRELQTLLELTIRLEYLPTEKLKSAVDLADRTGFLIHRLRKSLRAP
ncbi:MAG: four helix bundle protein [Gemmatimonadaceae bacterium]